MDHTKRTAKPAKLRDGTWGVRVTGTVRGGETVQVRTRSGKKWAAEIDQVLWSGTNDGQPVALCSTVARQQTRGRLVGRHTGEPCSCGNWGGAGPSCLYTYGEAKEAGEARHIVWDEA